MTTKKNKTKGFHEDVDPLLGKAKKHSIVAQKTKFDKEQVCDTSAIVPLKDDKDTITLRFVDSEQFTELAEQFEAENDVLLEINSEGDDIIVEIPVEKSEDFTDFLAERGIKVKDALAVDDAKNSEKVEDAIAMDDAKTTEEVEDAITTKITEEVGDKDDKDDAESLIESSEEPEKPKSELDEIINEVQNKRSKRAISKDKSRTAKRVGDKHNASDLISWLKSPGKSDLEGIDTLEAE